MDITNRKSHENKFLLEAEEIERIMEELTKLLADEPVDRKDALRLKLILEETLLNYMDFYPEGHPGIPVVFPLSRRVQGLPESCGGEDGPVSGEGFFLYFDHGVSACQFQFAEPGVEVPGRR